MNQIKMKITAKIKTNSQRTRQLQMTKSKIQIKGHIEYEIKEVVYNLRDPMRTKVPKC